MKTQVIFVGGIHGAGKSSLCQSIALGPEAIISKQRYLIREIAEKTGLITWEEIGLQHDLLIEEAAKRAVISIKKNEKELVLFDCHYSIRTDKAFRAKNKKINEVYIPDLDERLVSIMNQNFKIRFVLLETPPLVAAQRISTRPDDIKDIDSSLEFLIESEKFEKNYFLKMVNNFKITNCDFAIINNDKKFDDMTEHFKEFFLRKGCIV